MAAQANDLMARIRNLPRDFQVCVRFFSRLPAGSASAAPDFTTGAAAWPLAGAAIVALPALLLWFATLVAVPGLVAAGIAIAAMALLTGCLHEDGFADTADGFGGGQSAGRKLEIMRDSRIGTYGTAALIFNILLRVAALAAIVAGGNAVVALFGTAIVSRSLALWHWFILAPAREDGLAVSSGQPDEQALAIGSGIGFAALAAMMLWLGADTVFAVFLAALFVFAFTLLTQRQIGGHTGDTVGAAQQTAEIALLVGLAAGWGTA